MHLDAGATIVGVTATPIDCGNVCGIRPHVVVAGTNSDLRKCGALVAAHHYGCSEPEVRKIRKQILEFSEGDVRKVMMVPGLFACVLDEFQRLNPRHLPTLLFAPGVTESIWFAEQFRSAGIRSAHIDGKDCWLDGEFYKTNQEIRDKIVGLLRSGDVKVLTNRFVLREGVDLPFLRHIIIATILTTVQGYLQSLGRGLRVDRDRETVERFGPKEFLTVADHGGCWHRHGSLNVDRNWEIEYTLAENVIQGLREERMREKAEKEPFLCPHCKKVLTSSECLNCGFKVTRKSLPVVQADGTIRL
jgi:Helicase conserved C-terminal domain